VGSNLGLAVYFSGTVGTLRRRSWNPRDRLFGEFRLADGMECGRAGVQPGVRAAGHQNHQ
jgi:hypothetical protein